MAKKTGWWIFGLALLNAGIHLVFYNTLEFHRDELLYFSLGMHPAAGYASVPPLTGWVAWLMWQVPVPVQLAARIWPAFLSILLVVLTDAIVKILKGGPYARILASVAIVVTPINLRAFSMFQPVPTEVLFWTLVFYLVLRWIVKKEDWVIYLLGFVAGLALLNKYLVFLQFICLALVLLLFPYREMLRKRAFLFAILIAVVVFLPNIIWQFGHGLPVLTHMKALNDSQLVHVNRINFLTDQLFMAFAASLLVVPGLIYPLFKNNLRAARPLVLASILVIGVLLLVRGKSYYTAGIFPLLIALGAIFWENSLKAKWGKTSLVILLVVLTLPGLPMAMPVMNAERLAGYFAFVRTNIGFDAVLRDEDGQYHPLPQDYADMLGWEELAGHAGLAYSAIEDKKASMIFCENYGQAGAITVIGKKSGLPQAVSFSESFFYWAPDDFPAEITSVIYINDEMGADVDSLFRDIQKIGSISNPLAREYGTSVWLCRDPVTSFNSFWREIRPQVQSPF